MHLLLGGNGLMRYDGLDKGNINISSLGIGFYIAGAANTITGVPNAYGDHAILIIRTLYQSTSIATVLIDIEGSIGIYTRRGDNWTFTKQV